MKEKKSLLTVSSSSLICLGIYQSQKEKRKTAIPAFLLVSGWFMKTIRSHRLTVTILGSPPHLLLLSQVRKV